MDRLWAACAAIVMGLALGGMPVAGQSAQPSDLRLTILYDNTSTSPELTADLGFSA
jgi:predicted phosphoribosyltransferase